jgi:3-phenylpropionate/trans-cinnamate dioxygenase ferredoxin reductase subunit
MAFNHAKWLESYERLIEQAAAFPLSLNGVDRPTSSVPVPAELPDPRAPAYEATIVLTGHDPNERRVEWIPRRKQTTTAVAPAAP